MNKGVIWNCYTGGMLPRIFFKCKASKDALLTIFKSFFRFEIIINLLVRSSRLIRIRMLWVYDHYECNYSYSSGIDFRRPNPTSTDVRFSRSPRCKGLSSSMRYVYLLPSKGCHNVMFYSPFYLHLLAKRLPWLSVIYYVSIFLQKTWGYFIWVICWEHIWLCVFTMVYSR